MKLPETASNMAHLNANAFGAAARAALEDQPLRSALAKATDTFADRLGLFNGVLPPASPAEVRVPTEPERTVPALSVRLVVPIWLILSFRQHRQISTRLKPVVAKA